MTQLQGTIVRCGGATARQWYETISDVHVKSAERLRINFTMASKGGGNTDVQLEIPPASFSTILAAMSEVDREAALEAISLELSRQLSSEARRATVFKREGEYRVLQAARKRYRAKEPDKCEPEKTIYQGIAEIIGELERGTS